MPDDQVPIQFRTPADLEGGVYSNVVAVWHTAYEFTIDFATLLPSREEVETPDGDRQVVAPCRVVARVKVPPAIIFNVIRALNEAMTRYEGQYGSITRPDQAEPLYPPGDAPGEGEDQ